MATQQDLTELYRTLPKVDLHVHLDGSLSESFLASRAAAGDGGALPCPPADLRSHLLGTKTVSPLQAEGGNWPAFDFCNDYLQTTPALRAATTALLSEMHEVHNVRVLEVRFCPVLHTMRGLSEDDVVGAVAGAFEAYAAPRRASLRGGVLLCALRSHGEIHARQTFELAARWKAKGATVVGADVAGDEASFPLVGLESSLRDALVPLTVHAGEWAAGEYAAASRDNVKLAIEVGARRIGHGLVIAEDPDLVRRVRDAGVSVEVCLTSNISNMSKTGVNGLAGHPVKRLLEQNVIVAGFNCDNLLLSGTEELRPDPTAEVQRAVEVCGLSWTQVRSVLVGGACASFALSNTEEDKEFIRRFEADLDEELGKYALC